MRCPLLVCSALAIGAVVCFGSDAHARERPVFCDPPTVTVVARGAIVGAGAQLRTELGVPSYGLAAGRAVSRTRLPERAGRHRRGLIALRPDRTAI